MAVITLSLLAILGLLLKDQFFYEYDLKGYIDISRLDLDSSNYNKMSNLEAGTIIVTDVDGNKGIVEDTFFNIMMVCITLFAYPNNYCILGLANKDLWSFLASS